MNIERNITDEVNNITSLLNNARTEYTSGTSTNVSIPADYKVLFVLFRKVKVSGTVYTVSAGSTMEKIFNEAVTNFKYSVENFANKNVNIIPTVKIIDEEVESSLTTYLKFTDISSTMEKLAPAGMYDAMITASGANWGYGGATLPFMFANDLYNGYNFCGYSGCSINTANDSSAVGRGYDKNYPYLVTTNIFIHEWLHQLEGYRTNIKVNGQNIIYPFTHAYYSDYQTNPTADWMKMVNYKWDSTYFNDTQKYPHVVERRLTSFYRAVLACEVEYIPDNNHRVGMYPSFWKLCPHKTVLGTYIITNSQGQYYYCTSGGSPLTNSTLSNETAYFWILFYDISLSSNYLKKKSCLRKNSNSNFDLNNYLFTRVGTYDEGKYFIVNKTLNKVLGFTVANTSVSAVLENYRATTNEEFYLGYYENCFYTVCPDCTPKRYLDLNNVWNTEGNTVGFYIFTGYYAAQTWQFRYSNNNYKIMPLASATRSLSYYDNGLHIVSNNNVQNWRLEKSDNGKFVFSGIYRIKDAVTGKYLTVGGNGDIDSLILSNSATIWTFAPVNDNYYKIECNSGSRVRCIDVLNAYDIEGNTVQVHTPTAYANAQNWKFMLNLDGTVTIVPKLSLDRGIKSTTTGSTLTSNPSRFILIKC